MSQKNGIGDMSVVTCVITPNIRLLGTAASPIQRKRRQGVMVSTSFSCARSNGSLATGLGAGPFLIAVALAAVGTAFGALAVTAVSDSVGGVSAGSGSGLGGLVRTGASLPVGFQTMNAQYRTNARKATYA